MLEWKLLLVLLCVTSVFSYQRSSVHECIWHQTRCVNECPEGMIEVKSDCSQNFWKAPKTCENPEDMLVGTVCGFSRCDCPEPTVLDTDTGICYDVDNCPTKHLE